MQGTVIAIDRAKSYCDIYVNGTASTYRAPLGSFASDENMVVGADCEFNDISRQSLFSPGKAEVQKVKSLTLSNEKVAVTPEASFPEHKLIADNRKYLIAAEGGFEREARSALIEKAIECKANALLDAKLEIVIRPGVKSHLFRYTARPAIIDGPKYKQEPGIGLDIPVKTARRNSPNEAMVRYCRVLLICALFIIIPSILSMTARGVIPSATMGQAITAGIIVLTMVMFLFMSFKKRQSFILTLKGIHEN